MAQDHEDFLDFLDFVEHVQNAFRIPKRYIRDAENPMEFYEGQDFKRRYRFSKNIVMDVILPLVAERLVKVNYRGLPISPLIQLLTCLRYFATGNFQMISGNLRGISQQTVSVIIKRVSELIAKHLHDFTHLPNTQEQKLQNIQMFQGVAGFPGVAACIDCTHIKISSPGGDIAGVFRNRKGYFSLNVQVAVGPQMEMLDIVVRHPGSTHDSVIFDRSSLRVLCEQGETGGLLLGDNGYACRPYLLTPLIHPGNAREARYNRAHISTRNIVERVFGVWKRRFPCLYRGITTKLETTQAIICATATLYNICVKYNDNFHLEEIDQNVEPIIEQNINLRNEQIGLVFRNFYYKSFSNIYR